MEKQKKNKYGHIIKGDINIQNLWYARDSIVTTLNSLNILILCKRNSPMIKELREIIRKLTKRLRRTELKLGIK